MNTISKQDIIEAFQNCFLALTEPEVKKAFPHAKKIIKEYVDLFIDLEKSELINNTLPEYRENKLFLIGLNAIEKKKEYWLE